ncbi:MAG TPA: TonB-dependent receptor [Gemmatimonadaceae bacterium]|nr:TonB-dependent receptor [Gemmatimonadaceae bacterium]
MPRTVFAVLACATVACLPLSIAGAQGRGSPPQQDSVATRIEPTEIRGERGATVIGGAAAQVIRTDSLRGTASPTLADVLRSVPLVLVRQNSRGEVELSVRGSESRQVGIMLNGLPLSTGWDGRADPSLIPLSGVSKMTYVRATSTVLGGPNTLGGVIELSLDEPGADTGLRPRVSLGSDETGARLFSTALSGTTELDDASHLTWRAGGGIRQRDGLVRASGVPDPRAGAFLRTNTDTRESDAFASLGWHGSGGAGVSALVSGYDATRGVAPELHVSDPRLWRYPEQSRMTAQLHGATPLLLSDLGTTQFELSGGLLAGRTRIESFFDATYDSIVGTEGGNERVTTLRAAANHAFNNGLELRAALTSNRVSYELSEDGAPFAPYRQALLSAGAEARFPLGTRTLVSAGIVHDEARTLEAAGLPPLGRQTALGWRAGVTHQVSMRTRLHASASRRARFPALRELYSGSLNRFEPNPDLRPEELLATEVGVSLGDPTALGGLTAQVIGFVHQLDDGIVRVGFEGTNRFQRINRDETNSYGTELVLGWHGPGGHSLMLDVIAQKVRIKDRTAGGESRRPEHMPGFRAMLEGGMPLGGGVNLGAHVMRIGSQYCVNPEAGGDVALDAQTVGGATLDRGFSLGGGLFRTMRLILGVDNVANAAVYEQCGLPRAGRTLRLGVDLR